MKWILMMLAVVLVIGSVQVEKLTQLCCSEMRLDVDIITQLYTPHSTHRQVFRFIPCSEWSMGRRMVLRDDAPKVLNAVTVMVW